ncbi:hypothetical protein FKP32DRAFT_415611 [Trametes sanguinea]|nr:hypothetical protein FKP32DRAFT_415611 [Trametes sanguinea]
MIQSYLYEVVSCRRTPCSPTLHEDYRPRVRDIQCIRVSTCMAPRNSCGHSNPELDSGSESSDLRNHQAEAPRNHDMARLELLRPTCDSPVCHNLARSHGHTIRPLDCMSPWPFSQRSTETRCHPKHRRTAVCRPARRDGSVDSHELEQMRRS